MEFTLELSDLVEKSEKKISHIFHLKFWQLVFQLPKI